MLTTWLANLPSFRPPKVAAHTRRLFWWVRAASHRTEDRLGSSALWTQRQVVHGYHWCGTTDLWLAQFLKLWKEKLQNKSYYKELKQSVLLLFFNKKQSTIIESLSWKRPPRLSPIYDWSLPCQTGPEPWVLHLVVPWTPPGTGTSPHPWAAPSNG